MSGQVVLRPSGDLDVYSVPDFESQLLSAIARGDAEEVLVDLHDVGFVDSSGLGALIRGRTASDSGGLPLRLTRPRSQLLRLMSITSTYSLFDWR